MPGKPLIFDIGAHTGADTAFYLSKGFRVVAVEAFPDHVEKLRNRFRDALASGDLVIEPVAIGTEARTGSFLVHDTYDDWNREIFDEKHVSFGNGAFHEISVNFVDPSSLTAKHDIPYYIKIDIEGNDWIVVKAISSDYRPPFLSFEECKEYPELLAHLRDVGYQSFQIVDQSKHHRIRQRKPSLEGPYVEMTFDGFMSGPFGRDLPDRWVNLDTVLRESTWLPYDRNEWYDYHASIHPSRFGRLMVPPSA